MQISYHFIIAVKEVMLFSSLFPRNDRINIHVFNALENMLFNLRICLLQLCNKLFYLHTL